MYLQHLYRDIVKNNPSISETQKKYIKAVQNLFLNKYTSILHTLGLFGSLSRGMGDKFSDIDFIIVLKENINISIKQIVIKELKFIEQTFLLSGKSGVTKSSFIRSLLEITGMFKSYFITTQEELQKNNFRSIFNISRGINRIAPQNIILMAMLREVKWYFPNKTIKLSVQLNFKIIFSNLRLKTNFRREFTKGYFTAQLLALGALFITPLFFESTKFSIEALKWANLTCKILYDLRITNLNTIETKIYSRDQPTQIHQQKSFLRLNSPQMNRFSTFERIKFLRRSYKRDPILNFVATFTVWRIFHRYIQSTK